MKVVITESQVEVLRRVYEISDLVDYTIHHLNNDIRIQLINFFLKNSIKIFFINLIWIKILKINYNNKLFHIIKIKIKKKLFLVD